MPNEEQRIEELLRKAPRPPMPDGLSERLQQQISLPKARPAPVQAGWVFALPGNWIPALSFSILLLLSVIIIGATSSQIAKLNQANEILRAENAQLEELRQEHAALQKLHFTSYELDRMRKQSEELAELRGEIEQIQAELAQAGDLAAENQRLQAELEPLGRSGVPAYLDEQVFAEARERAKEQAGRIACVNNLKHIGLAARIWATTNNEHFPVDFSSMSRELNTPRLLICPSDPMREPAADWTLFTPGHTSYEMLSPGISETQPQTVYVKCPFHENVALTDGSVHQLNAGQVVVLQEGRWVVRTPSE